MTFRQLTYNMIWAAATAMLLYSITRVDHWGIACSTVLALSLVGVNRDTKTVPWAVFMPAGFLALSLFYLIYRHAGGFWEHVIFWQTKSIHHLFQWNNFFNAIPGNDGAWFRLWQPHWLTHYMKTVYAYGFTLSFWVCVIRSFFTKDIKKFARYSLAGYLLQVPLILPFYNTVLLQEVWFVQGTPDLLDRGWSLEEQGPRSVNCFPSMHTSIAFAAILLSLRERSAFFRGLLLLLCGSIIISTLYLKVHWLIDIFAGMMFAYGCVKLSDLIVESSRFQKVVALWERLGLTLYSVVAIRREKPQNQPTNS